MQNRVLGQDILEPEGPVCLPDSSVYVVEMAKERTCISRININGQRTEVGKTGGRPNGLTIDGNGNLWIAGGKGETLVCMTPDGTILKRFVGPSGDPYLWPNDLAFGPNGLLYMTDSGILPNDFIDGQAIREDHRTCPYNGRIFEIDPKSGEVLRTLDSGLKFTNGIAFDLSDNLYVNETVSGNVYVYQDALSKDPTRELFGNVLAEHTEKFVGPDGMAFGNNGSLYCTVFGQGDVTILNPSGSVDGRIKTNGRRPTNVAFRLDKNTAVVTDLGLCELEELTLPCGGRPLYKPKL